MYYIIYPAYFGSTNRCFAIIYDRRSGKAVWETAWYDTREECEYWAKSVMTDLQGTPA